MWGHAVAPGTSPSRTPAPCVGASCCPGSGSSWAWIRPSSGDRSESSETRTLAAASLLEGPAGGSGRILPCCSHPGWRGWVGLLALECSGQRRTWTQHRAGGSWAPFECEAILGFDNCVGSRSEEVLDEEKELI